MNCPISKGRPYAGAQILWPERRDLKLLITKAGSRTIQISWSKGTVCSVSRNKDKGDAGILKGICYIICWSGNLLLSYYLPSICMMFKRQLYHCKNMPDHAANTHCGFSSQPSCLYVAAAFNVVLSGKHLPSQCLCQIEVTFLNPYGRQIERKRHERSSRFVTVLFSWYGDTPEDRDVHQPHPEKR